MPITAIHDWQLCGRQLDVRCVIIDRSPRVVRITFAIFIMAVVTAIAAAIAACIAVQDADVSHSYSGSQKTALNHERAEA